MQGVALTIRTELNLLPEEREKSFSGYHADLSILDHFFDRFLDRRCTAGSKNRLLNVF